ncbi:MAG: NAD(P)H-dependent oxidoreductase [Parcubacteria group bacterium]|nr:NAD(P)H-dependent oxidoreductase [Parcubacteria group bacterium]MCR4342966.1 NAD(P)H-dependent oxidoreductase [Patescibacteria group bacterium]
MNKKVTVILGHPSRESFCGSIMQSYIDGAKESGKEVREVYIGDLKFDPILWKGYSSIQELEEDLKKAQEDMRWADHLVFVYPTWWGGMPALMKGFVDRVFLPGFGFKFNKGQPYPDRLLSGKSAHLIVTMDNKQKISEKLFGAPSVVALKKIVLEFCGVNPVDIKIISSLRKFNDEKKQELLSDIKNIGKTV